MLVIHNRPVRVPVPGASPETAVWLRPLSSEDRDACVAESNVPKREDQTKEQWESVRNALYYQALGRRALVRWEGIAGVNAVGDLEPLPVNDENRELLMRDPDVQLLVANKATGLGLKVFASLEEAGNALHTGHAGTGSVAQPG